jgi:hypothetical protein
VAKVTEDGVHSAINVGLAVYNLKRFKLGKAAKKSVSKTIAKAAAKEILKSTVNSSPQSQDSKSDHEKKNYF